MKKLAALFCLMSLFSTAYSEEAKHTVSKVYFKANQQSYDSTYEGINCGYGYNNVVNSEHMVGWIVAENSAGGREVAFPVKLDIRSTGATVYCKMTELGYTINFSNWDGKKLSTLLGRFNGFKGQVIATVGFSAYSAVNFKSGTVITNASSPYGVGADLSVVEIRVLPFPGLAGQNADAETLQKYKDYAESVVFVKDALSK